MWASGLQVAVAEADRDLERRERVLWSLTGPTTVGEGDRAGLVEERVQAESVSRDPSRFAGLLTR